MTGQPRAAIGTLPSYRPGRSASARRGVEPAKLSSNELPYDPLPSVEAALRSASATVHRYPDHPATAVRAALADRYQVSDAQVTVGCGAVGLIQQLALAYLEPGANAVFADPSFEAYPIMTTLAGATSVRVPLRRQTIDLDQLADAIDERTRLVLVANPNNPTGTSVDDAALARFAERVPPSCLVVFDEAYREFAPDSYPGSHPGSPRASRDAVIDLVDRHRHVVVLRTFSKAYGLAALRIGYAIADPDVVEMLDRVRLPFAVNSIAQCAAIASLAASDEMQVRVGEVAVERDRLTRELRRLGWSVPDAHANFVWLPTPAEAVQLAEQLDECGVIVRPFEGVGVRVTVGSPSDNDRFLDAFDRATERLDSSEWTLPTGDEARRVQAALDDIDLALARLTVHAGAPEPAEWLSRPDARTGERWDTGQVWAHMAEFGGYWLPELRTIVDAPDGATTPVPFGRTTSDPHRIAMIEQGRRTAIGEHLDTVRRDMMRFRGEIAQLTPDDWRRRGVHPTLGVMAVERFLDEFATGHYHQHADQLDHRSADGAA